MAKKKKARSKFFMSVYRNYRSVAVPASEAIKLTRRFEAKKISEET